MEIVKMELRHVPEIAALEICCFSDPWSARSIESELHNALSLWLVAEDDGKVAGYIGSQTVLDMADMMNVAVAPEFRRSGIAEKLILELIRQLDSRGTSALTLEVRDSNTGAIALYHRLGFEQIGRRKNYYHKPKEDALILQKRWKELAL